MRAEEKASREMKKLAFVACVAAVLAYGADVVYMPNAKENGIYDWRTVGNWYTVNGGALGALPTADDTVYVTNTTFATEWVVIPPAAEISIKALYLQMYKSGSPHGIRMKIDGGTLNTTASSFVGHQYPDTVLSIENGGRWNASSDVRVGYGAASNCVLNIDKNSSFYGNHLYIHYGGGLSAGSLAGRVENRGTVSLTGKFWMSYRDNASSSCGSRLDNYGSFTTTANQDFHIGRVNRSRAVICNYEGATMTIGAATAYIAYQTNSTACVTNDGTMALKNFSLGARVGSVGIFRNNGQLTIDATGTVSVGGGSEADASGIFENYGTVLFGQSPQQFNIGSYGYGRFVVAHDMNYPDTSNGRRKTIYLGVKADCNAYGELIITNGATLTMTNGEVRIGQQTLGTGVVELYEGSRLEAPYAVTVGPSAGSINNVLRMRGGELLLLNNATATSFSPQNSTIAALTVGSPTHNADLSNGLLEGWGVIGKTDPASSSGNNKVGLVLYNGLVRADGVGVARDLDMRLFQDMNKTAPSSNSCGTNGWYAVGKGRLRYPARYHGSGTARIVGDCATRAISTENLPLVNSFGVTFPTTDDQLLANRAIYADLYASDRTDMPAGLPEAYPGATALGVWHMALSSDVTEPKSNKKVTGFGSADILLHYDRVKLMNLKKNGAWPGDLQLAFCVHDGTAAGGWRTVACVQPSDDSPFIAGQVAESTDTWNLGWFAVVPVRLAGTMVIFR